jgi:hypothetical protein
MYRGVESSPSTEILNFRSERNELISLIKLFENFNFAVHKICHVEADAIEVVVVSLGNVLLGYHGHECNDPLPGYRHLAIVGHVGCPHTSVSDGNRFFFQLYLPSAVPIIIILKDVMIHIVHWILVSRC